MVDEQAKALAETLDSLGRRIQARMDDFRLRGEFSDVHAASLKQLSERCEALSAVVATSLPGKGATVKPVPSETIRDVDALVGDVETLIFNASAAEMKSHG